MFDSLNDDKLRAAHDAARLLYDNYRALGLDPLAIKLDTLRVDISVEPGYRAGLHGERQVLDGNLVAVALGEVLDLDHESSVKSK